MDQSTVGGVVVEANDAMLQFPYGASQALVAFGEVLRAWLVLPCLGCAPIPWVAAAHPCLFSLGAIAWCATDL